MRDSPCCDARGTSRIIFSGGKGYWATLRDVLHLYDSNSTQLLELKPLYVLFLSEKKLTFVKEDLTIVKFLLPDAVFSLKIKAVAQ